MVAICLAVPLQRLPKVNRSRVQTAQNQGLKRLSLGCSHPKVEQLNARGAAEELRYRHLWIAYALVWLIIFVFVFRTWKMNQGTCRIKALKSRLKKLESADGPDELLTAPPVTHFVYIPFILFIGGIIGFVVGQGGYAGWRGRVFSGRL